MSFHLQVRFIKYLVNTIHNDNVVPLKLNVLNPIGMRGTTSKPNKYRARA